VSFVGVISARTCSNRCRQALKYKRTKERTA
jgi:predicted nucleic acid-binding Zn ribbon protein